MNPTQPLLFALPLVLSPGVFAQGGHDHQDHAAV
jgi:hypothetical protein